MKSAKCLDIIENMWLASPNLLLNDSWVPRCETQTLSNPNFILKPLILSNYIDQLFDIIPWSNNLYMIWALISVYKPIFVTFQTFCTFRQMGKKMLRWLIWFSATLDDEIKFNEMKFVYESLNDEFEREGFGSKSFWTETSLSWI